MKPAKKALLHCNCSRGHFLNRHYWPIHDKQVFETTFTAPGLHTYYPAASVAMEQFKHTYPRRGHLGNLQMEPLALGCACLQPPTLGSPSRFDTYWKLKHAFDAGGTVLVKYHDPTGKALYVHDALGFHFHRQVPFSNN
jgi:hypothetical protein